MFYPLRIRNAISEVRDGAHTLVVAWGPREWAWRQASSWAMLDGFTAVLCPADQDPLDLDWSIAADRAVFALFWGEVLAGHERLERALLRESPRELHIIDISVAGAMPAHWQKQGDKWTTWSGLGKPADKETDRSVKTVDLSRNSSKS